MLETYLPPSVSAEEIDQAVAQAIAETGAAGPKDMGKVMKAVMAGSAGQDGRRQDGQRTGPGPPEPVAALITGSVTS